MKNGLCEFLLGLHAGILPCFSLHDYQGFLQVSADGDGVTDRLPDGLTDKSDDVQMERNFPRIWTFRKFCPATLISIFAMNLADGLTDRTDDGHTDGQTEFQVESLLG